MKCSLCQSEWEQRHEANDCPLAGLVSHPIAIEAINAAIEKSKPNADDLRHIEIGRLIEAMPPASALFRGFSGWEFDPDAHPDSDGMRSAYGATPLEALTKGKKT